MTKKIALILTDTQNKEVCRAMVSETELGECNIVNFEGRLYQYQSTAVFNPTKATFKAIDEKPMKIFDLKRADLDGITG